MVDSNFKKKTQGFDTLDTSICMHFQVCMTYIYIFIYDTWMTLESPKKIKSQNSDFYIWPQVLQHLRSLCQIPGCPFILCVEHSDGIFWLWTKTHESLNRRGRRNYSLPLRGAGMMCLFGFIMSFCWHLGWDRASPTTDVWILFVCFFWGGDGMIKMLAEIFLCTEVIDTGYISMLVFQGIEQMVKKTPVFMCFFHDSYDEKQCHQFETVEGRSGCNRKLMKLGAEVTPYGG